MISQKRCLPNGKKRYTGLHEVTAAACAYNLNSNGVSIMEISVTLQVSVYTVRKWLSWMK